MNEALGGLLAREENLLAGNGAGAVGGEGAGFPGRGNGRDGEDGPVGDERRRRLGYYFENKNKKLAIVKAQLIDTRETQSPTCWTAGDRGPKTTDKVGWPEGGTSKIAEARESPKKKTYHEGPGRPPSSLSAASLYRALDDEEPGDEGLERRRGDGAAIGGGG